MISYSIKMLRADELYFKVNPIKPDQKQFEMKPAFTRQIRPANEDPKIHIVILECKIEGKDDAPTPFDLRCRFVGIFEVKDLVSEEDKRIFAINATETMFPYLRAAITNVTADALVAPFNLPIVSGATLFPEDRGNDQYTLNFDPKVVN